MSEAPSAGLTEDRLLGGRLALRQPENGYRVAIDPVFLAASLPAEPHHTVLDIGCGVGAAMLCLAARVPQCRIVGLETQRDLVRLATDNIMLNDMAGRLSVMVGDLLRPPPRLSPGSFDHVMANPPYLEHGRATAPSDAAKALSRIEGEAGLAAWVRFALSMVRAKGAITFIHRPDRIDALLAEIAGRAGEVAIFPLWPQQGKPASRVIVRARKDTAAPARLLPGLVLHQEDGRLSPPAEGVLRHGRALSF